MYAHTPESGPRPSSTMPQTTHQIGRARTAKTRKWHPLQTSRDARGGCLHTGALKALAAAQDAEEVTRREESEEKEDDEKKIVMK